jgi:hypothetical protein
MYIKRLAEIFVQKALLLFEILSFEVYCRSDSDSRLADTGSRRLPDSLIWGVGDFFNFRDNFRRNSNCFAFVPIISRPNQNVLLSFR